MVHRTSADGLMWGLDGYTEGITDIFSIHPGHAGIYVGISNDPNRGFEDSTPQVVEAIGRPPNSGVVEINDLADFCSHSTMEFLGAQTTEGLTAEQRANIVILSCDQIGEGYNEDMSSDGQKGPGDNQWICSGLAEKVYESCNKNFAMDLSYYHRYPYEDEDGTVHAYPGYVGWGGVDVTPDGRIDTPGNEVSETVEQTKINWLIFYRYIFFPYTQMIQPVLIDAQADIPTTWATLSPPQPDEDNGWYTTDVEVTLHASDGDSGSGIYYVRYCVGSEGNWILYESPYQVGETNYIYSYAKDNAGNYPASVYPDAYIKIDKRPPQFGSFTNTINPEPGSYEMLHEIIDADSGVRDDSSYPRIYFRWNEDVIDQVRYDGYVPASYDPTSGCYKTSMDVDVSHIGDRIYWRCLALDIAGLAGWSNVHDGGVIGSGNGTPWVTPIPSIQPTPSPSPTLVATPTPQIVRCFQVAGRVVDKDNGVALPGAVARAVCPDRRGSTGETGADGEYELEVCTRFEDGTVRVQARRAGYLPGYVDAFYTDWAGEGVVAMGDIELERSSVYSGGLVSGDYDGDSRADIAVFRPASGLWAIRGLSRFYFGQAGDELIPADYAGDGTATAGIFRPATGLWAIRGLSRIYFGDFGDVPVSGDYRGDGTAEIGIFRPAEGLWAIRTFTRAYFGVRYDQPVPGDYAGDGLWNPAVFRSSTGLWAIRGVSRFYFGRSGDLLVPGDFDGLGYRAAGIFRPASGLWAIRGVTRVYFGRSGDQPVPADYLSRGTDNIAIYRPSSGLWAIRQATRTYFGREGDIPVSR